MVARPPPKSPIHPMKSKLKNGRQPIWPSKTTGALPPRGPKLLSLTINSDKAPVYPTHRHKAYLIQTFHKYLLSPYYVPGTVLSIPTKIVNKMLSLLSRSLKSSGEDEQRQHKDL